MDPNCEKILVRPNQRKVLEIYRRCKKFPSYRKYRSLGTPPDSPGSIAPQPRGCEHRPIRLKKALDEIFRKSPFSALAPFWLWSNRTWKVSLGGVPRLRYFRYWRVIRRQVMRHFTTSLSHIESNFDRLGFLVPTHGQRSQRLSGQITLQSVLINKAKFLKAVHHTEIKKMKYRGPCW